MIKKYFFFTCLLVCSVFLLSACGKTTVNQPVVKEIEKNQEEEGLKGSIKDLLGLGKNVECSWKFENEETKMEGMAWVSGKRTMVETKVSFDQKEIKGYFVSDGEMVYSWGDTTPGIKFKLTEFENNEVEAPQADRGQESENWDKKYEYKCKPWAVEENKFMVPRGVEFTDMGEQMEQMQEQAGKMQENMKGLCDSLPEAQKIECLKGFETE